MVELKGSLSGIGLPSVIELIGDLHQSGYLQLRNEHTTAQLTFDDGHLVEAESGELRGLEAIAACATQLTDGEFTFIEGTPDPDHRLDLGPADLKRLFASTKNGHDASAVNGSATAVTPPALACPLLGFADDRARHYGRPTALHRCFASAAAGLVTATDQRELCLSGKFTTCDRYRAADQARVADPTEIQPPPPPRPAPPPIPPGVASRLAAAGQMRIGAPPTTPEAAAAPPDLTPTTGARPKSPPKAPAPNSPEVAPRRPGLPLVAAGVVIGLFLLALLLFVALPALGGRLGQRPATSSVALEPLATATSQPAGLPVATPVSSPTGARAVAAAGVGRSPTALPRAVGPTTPPAATAPSLGKQLVDLRFAAGPADNWVDTTPYAGWSDGAYRLQDHDANRFVAVAVPLNNQQQFSDVVVSATFRKTGGPPGGGYGLIVRAQSDQPLDGLNQEFNGYVVETSDLGDYGVWRREGDHWIDLVPWTHSTSVRSGGSPNDLSVKAIGPQLTFMVNGTVQATIDDNTLDSGRIGLFAGGDYNEVALDQFSVDLP